ncbi:MAG: sialate O-acetylesterase [Chitinophagaceae bacterium]|nr:MAG: sialate O-acetylesterase [Chitinophagaceae bacterium]
MKKIIFLFAVIAALQAGGQIPKWDSTHRPGNFALKVDLFRSYPNSAKDIIFLGNSITAGVDWVELLGNPVVRNRGISGDITFGVLERLHEVTEGAPAKVFILIGINDISRNIPDSVIVGNYEKMIRQIKKESPKTKIYFQTLLPVNNNFTQFKNHYNKDEHILFVNESLKALAAKEKITLIDLYPHFLDSEKKMDKRFTIDGLHLNAEGYKVWSDVLKKGGYL